MLLPIWVAVVDIRVAGKSVVIADTYGVCPTWITYYSIFRGPPLKRDRQNPYRANNPPYRCIGKTCG